MILTFARVVEHGLASRSAIRFHEVVDIMDEVGLVDVEKIRRNRSNDATACFEAQPRLEPVEKRRLGAEDQRSFLRLSRNSFELMGNFGDRTMDRSLKSDTVTERLAAEQAGMIGAGAKYEDFHVPQTCNLRAVRMHPGS